MMIACMLILDLIIVLVLPPSELMQFMIPLLELLQSGVKQLFIVGLITMAVQAEGK